MSTKTKIISAISAVLILALGSFYFWSRNKQATNLAQQNRGEVSTGTGGLNNLPPLQTTTGRNLPQAHVDPTQPFAINSPRSNEPAAPKNTNPKSNSPAPQDAVQQKVNQAVSEGLIPNKDGSYVQNIDQSGVNKYDASRYNYSMDPNTFAATYYPDFAQVARNGSAPAPGSDPLLLDSGTSAVPTTVPQVAGVNPKLFKTTNVDTQAVYTNYLKGLNASISPLNIVATPSIVSNVAAVLNDNPTVMDQYQQSTLKILADLQAQTVPAPMLGLQESYYATYTEFNKFLQANIDYAKAVQDGRTADSGKALNVIQVESDLLSPLLSSTTDALGVAQTVLQAKGLLPVTTQ